ncbi:MAG TPA: hypothetical protein VFK05_13320 [Polyangiaceae bacterium]|nr:hypothetical protein [Polyangiaceae bacterium]
MATKIPIANGGAKPKVQSYHAASPELMSSSANAGEQLVLLDDNAAFAKRSSTGAR